MCIVPRIVRKTITPSQPIPIIVSKYQRSIIPTWQHETKVKIFNFKVLANLQIGQRSNSGRWHNLHITVLRKNIQKGINFEACLQSVHFSEGSNLHPLHGINSPQILILTSVHQYPSPCRQLILHCPLLI